MEDKLKKLLLSFDDKEECETPENFNYTNEMKKIYNIKKQLENIIKKELITDECVQDASFFTQLVILEEIQNERKNNGGSFAQ
ncbi:hypothetical protein G8V03_14565 [Clostridium botulinum D/C]|uniref:hypothetical protein n=1 Tax=Clostridium botulinum TaxID=1491 RepID=UPI001E3C823D|nr:hypothetical protein [Clostridium botulinum]MCD3351651.1 hypothetical protein [Clostridium botulinum D/C]MCD3361126.1 hypothetical protein [Clostridium botulinum D/C]MCD3363628.1 hypothetical protein [Clostridium botulinum D/C]MCD3366810.1 hypothetical protein [Clostridium botulinum D/C]